MTRYPSGGAEDLLPALEVWVERGGASAKIRMAGTLDARTQAAVLDGLTDLLDQGCRRLAVDVSDLVVADLDGAHALAEAQRRARDATAALTWRGVDHEQLRKHGVTVRKLGYVPRLAASPGLLQRSAS